MQTLYNTHTPSTSPGLVEHIMPHPTQRFVELLAQSSDLTAEKFNCLVLSVLRFASSYVADTCISITVYELCLLPLETQVLTVTDKTYHPVHF